MKKKSSINTVLDMVKAFLKGDMSYINFQLDFPYEVQKRYQKIACEDEEFASLINERLVENGVYRGGHLEDDAFRGLIGKPHLKVVEISEGGFCSYLARLVFVNA